MLHFGWPGCLNLYNENPLCCLPQIEVRDRREPRYGVQRLHWGQQWHWKPSLLFSSLLFSSLLFSSLLSPICFSEFSSLLVPSLLSSPMIRISPTFNADTKCTGFCKIKTTTTTTTTKNTGINYILKKNNNYTRLYSAFNTLNDFLNEYLYDEKKRKRFYCI